MLLRNLGYRWGDLTDSAHGLVVLASGRSRGHVERSLPSPGSGRVLLFDPQAYLTCLDPDECGPTCARLVSYPWFTDQPIEFDDEEQGLREWERDLRTKVTELWQEASVTDQAEIGRRMDACVGFQAALGVDAVIIPTPGALDVASDIDEQLSWIDAGVEACDRQNLPPLATICLRVQSLPSKPPPEELFEAIIDHVTAREKLAGAYLVVEAGGEGTVRLHNATAVSALLYLCQEIGLRGRKRVVVNFVEALGVACLALGAWGFATGYENRMRRLSLDDFVERHGGRTYPKFYAHRLVNDYRPKSDMERLRSARLLRYLASDRTQHSSDLLAQLESGGSAADLPTWAETVNNVVSARLHYYARLRAVVDDFPRNVEEASRSVLEWLQDAERDAEYLAHRFEGDPVGEDTRHIAVWRAAFESRM